MYTFIHIFYHALLPEHIIPLFIVMIEAGKYSMWKTINCCISPMVDCNSHNSIEGILFPVLVITYSGNKAAYCSLVCDVQLLH